MIHRSRLVAIVLTSAMLPGIGLAAEEPRIDPLAEGDESSPTHVERIDDPPALHDPRDDPAARSPGVRVGVPPYMSVQVNVDSADQNIVGDAANEPSIAVNPTDPDNMVIGWRQFDSISSNFRQGGWAFTTDGGDSWTFPGVLEPGVFRSDPVLDFDSDGNVFYQSLRSTFELDVYRSDNGGSSWGFDAYSWGGDKNWMAIDRSGGQGDGHIYGIWQRFFGCCGLDIFTRSTDGGLSYEAPVEVERSPAFGTMAVGPSGEVYAVGIDGTVTQDFDTFVVSRSADAANAASGPTFDGVIVDLGGSMVIGSGPNPAGLLGQATVAVSHAPGSSYGNVYLVASVNPPGPDPLDVHFARSIDGGQSWSAPVRVNDDGSNNNWQWFGAVAASPNGRIDVVWNDSRFGGQASIAQLFYSYSWDQGLTWSPNAVVSPQFNSLLGFPQQNKMGDYLDIVSSATGADVAYAATFNGEQDVYYVRVFPDCNSNGTSDVSDVATGSSPDCNLNRVPDECETSPACVGSGAVPDGRYVAGRQLTVGVAAGDQISLRWGTNCLPLDNDYEIYEGSLGDFAGHSPRFCTTGGETELSFEPAAFDSYYLVVPTNQSQEGSYGRGVDGAQRPPSRAACRPQAVIACLGSGG